MEEPDSTVGNPYFDYRKLLDNISIRLQKENALRLANLYELPSWYFEIGPSQDPSYALRVLIAMEGKGVFAPSNLKGLIEALKNIEREDLSTTVKDFVKQKYEQGVSQEKMRRLTHPRESEMHPPFYPEPRPTSSIAYCGISSYNSPQLYHSTSLGSIAVEGCIQETGEPDGQRSRSRPNLSHFLKGEEVAVDSGNVNLHSPLELQPGPCGPISPESMQLVLLSAQSFVKQLEVLSSSVSTGSMRSESTPAKDSDQMLLCKSVASAKRSMHCLQSLSSRYSEAKGRHFSHSNSYTTNLSHRSSVGSETALVERDLLSDSVRSEPATVFSDSKSKSKGTRVKRNSSLSAPRPDSMHPMHSSPILLRSNTTSEHSQSFTPSAPAIPTPLAQSLPVSYLTTRGRLRSKNQDKKINKRGIMVWNLKVKRLKNLVGHPGSKIESEEFYDFSKRPLRAALYPRGLGEDVGSHMTLTIQCLEEPKSSTIPNLEIVVNVIDPHSDSKTPMVCPIRRSLERRGIRLVQQFLAHSMVDSFKCSYITITVAIVGKQAESEDSEPGDMG